MATAAPSLPPCGGWLFLSLCCPVQLLLPLTFSNSSLDSATGQSQPASTSCQVRSLLNVRRLFGTSCPVRNPAGSFIWVVLQTLIWIGKLKLFIIGQWGAAALILNCCLDPELMWLYAKLVVHQHCIMGPGIPISVGTTPGYSSILKTPVFLFYFFILHLYINPLLFDFWACYWFYLVLIEIFLSGPWVSHPTFHKVFVKEIMLTDGKECVIFLTFLVFFSNL